MPLNADKALLSDTIFRRYGGQRQGRELRDMMRRGIGRYYEANATIQERLMRAMQYSFVEFEQGRTGDNTLTYLDVQGRFRNVWLQSMKDADYEAHRASVPNPIPEVA